MSDKKPAPAIGLRQGERVDGTKFLHGIVANDLHLKAGSRVSLRRVSSNECEATHVIVFAAPMPGQSDTKKQLQQAAADSLWSRVDTRDTE
tara:strand:+ start:197 stop:469 length:273 start_codon:yes stop_codon:yes gene_type:complete